MATAALPREWEPVTVPAPDSVSETFVRPPARGWAAMGQTLTNEPYRLLIGGSWVEGSNGSYGIVNPATEEVVAEAPEASTAAAEAAAAAARPRSGGWPGRGGRPPPTPKPLPLLPARRSRSGRARHARSGLGCCRRW